MQNNTNISLGDVYVEKNTLQDYTVNRMEFSTENVNIINSIRLAKSGIVTLDRFIDITSENLEQNFSLKRKSKINNFNFPDDIVKRKLFLKKHNERRRSISDLLTKIDSIVADFKISKSNTWDEDLNSFDFKKSFNSDDPYRNILDEKIKLFSKLDSTIYSLKKSLLAEEAILLNRSESIDLSELQNQIGEVVLFKKYRYLAKLIYKIDRMGKFWGKNKNINQEAFISSDIFESDYGYGFIFLTSKNPIKKSINSFLAFILKYKNKIVKGNEYFNSNVKRNQIWYSSGSNEIKVKGDYSDNLKKIEEDLSRLNNSGSSNKIESSIQTNNQQQPQTIQE